MRLRGETWRLDKSYQGEEQIISSGMVVLTVDRQKISVGYNYNRMIEENLLLISAAPELLDLLLTAEDIINGKCSNYDQSRFWDKLEQVKDKINIYKKQKS